MLVKLSPMSTYNKFRGLRFRVEGLGSRAEGLGFRVWGKGFMGLGVVGL